MKEETPIFGADLSTISLNHTRKKKHYGLWNNILSIKQTILRKTTKTTFFSCHHATLMAIDKKRCHHNTFTCGSISVLQQLASTPERNTARWFNKETLFFYLSK